MTRETISLIASKGRAAGFASTEYGRIDDFPLIALAKESDRDKPTVSISAGIHGDEPAAVAAVQSLLGSELFDTRFSWRIFPALNPAGLRRGTRENAAGIDLNRDFDEPKSEEIRTYVRHLANLPPADFAICIHEDWEATGFYLYALGNPFAEKIGAEVLRAVAGVAAIDQSPLIDEREAKNGLLLPPPDFDPAEIGGLPEALYHHRNGARLCLTLETPSSLPLAERVATHVTAVTQCIESYDAILANCTDAE